MRDLHNTPWLTNEFFDESQENWGWEGLAAFHLYISKKIDGHYSCEERAEKLKELLLWDIGSEREFFYCLCNAIVNESQSMSNLND